MALDPKIRLFSAGEAAAHLGVSERWVRALAAGMGIRRVGRDWLFSDADLMEMEQRTRRCSPGRMRRLAACD